MLKGMSESTNNDYLQYKDSNLIYLSKNINFENNLLNVSIPFYKIQFHYLQIYKPYYSMAETGQNNQLEDIHLPSVLKGNLKNTLNQSQKSSSQDQNINLPQTHHRKRKKHHKKQRKHSPEYYLELKLKRLNRMKESAWNDRFINQQIPNLFEKKKHKSKSPQSKNNKLQSKAKNYQPAGKTITSSLTKVRQTLPETEKKNKTSKSFKISIVPKKNNQLNTQKTEKAVIKTQKPHSSNDFGKQKHRQQYQTKINNIFQQTKNTISHKQILEQFLKMTFNKGIRDMLDKQLERVQNKTSKIFEVIESIEKREKLLDRLKETGLLNFKEQNKEQQAQKQFIQLVASYRATTLKCIQEYLKWKLSWEGTYHEVFKTNKCFELIYQGNNYMLTILNSTDSLIANYHKHKQIKAEEANSSKQIQKQKDFRDPFIIQPYGLNLTDKNMAIKIRSSELFLIEEEYNWIRK